jgi:hypothetical protein
LYRYSVSFAAITLSVASQRVFIVVAYFVIDSVRKLLDTPSYTTLPLKIIIITTKVKHKMKAYWGSGGIAPRIR